jgi:hypothetical protein
MNPEKKATKPTPVESKKTEDMQVNVPEVNNVLDAEKKDPEVKPIAADKKVKKEDTFPMLERAKEVFASHTVDVLYFTEDNTAFLEPQFARIHAESLKSQKVTPIERKEIV